MRALRRIVCTMACGLALIAIDGWGAQATRAADPRLTAPMIQPLTGIVLSPTAVLGGAVVGGTVTLRWAAPAGGATVSIQSSSPAVTVPPTVMVHAGYTSANFQVQTRPVSGSRGTAVTISGRIGSAPPLGAALTVLPPALGSLTVFSPSVTGGTSAYTSWKVTINGPAPAQGMEIALSSNHSALVVPKTVVIPGGWAERGFQLPPPQPVATSATVTVTASAYGVTKTASVMVLAPLPSSLSFTPSAVYPDASGTTGRLIMSGVAPAGGIRVALSVTPKASGLPANPPCVTPPTVPVEVTVPAGASTASFPVTANPSLDKGWRIGASHAAAGVPNLIEQDLSVFRVPTVSFQLPGSVKGGTLLQGKVVVSGPLPRLHPRCLIWSLSSSNTALAQVVTPQIVIPPGSREGSFTITTSAVVSAQTVRITLAGPSGETTSVRLTLTP